MLVLPEGTPFVSGCLGLLNGCHGRPPSSGDFPIAMPPLFRPPAGCASVRHRLWKRITRCGMIIRILYTHIYLHIYNLILIWFTVICNYIIHSSHHITYCTEHTYYICMYVMIYVYIYAHIMHILQSTWSVIRCDPDSATPVLLRPRNGFKGILPQIWRVQPRTPEVEAERLHEALVTLINHWILGTPFPDLKAIFHHGTTVLPQNLRLQLVCCSFQGGMWFNASKEYGFPLITPYYTQPFQHKAHSWDRCRPCWSLQARRKWQFALHGVNGAEQPDSIWPLPRYQMRSAKVVRCTRCSDIWRSVGSVVPLLRLVPVNWQSLIATKQRQKAWPCLGYNYITWYHIYPLISPQNNKKIP